MSTDPWISLSKPAPKPEVTVRKYSIVSTDGQTATLETVDGEQFDVRFPSSLQPLSGSWAWCLQTNGQLWPFAVD